MTEAELASDVFLLLAPHVVLLVSVGKVGIVETVGPVGFAWLQSHLMMMMMNDNGDNGSVAPLRLKDLDLLVAIGGATCLVNGLLEAVLASSAVLPDPLLWSVPPPFSGGNLISYIISYHIYAL